MINLFFKINQYVIEKINLLSSKIVFHVSSANLMKLQLLGYDYIYLLAFKKSIVNIS